MSLSPHAHKQDKQNPGSHKQPAAFVSWVKKVFRFAHKQRSALHEAGVKHDINRLERERAKEHSALLQQRKFYERLIKRKPEHSVFAKPQPQMPLPSKPATEPKEMPVLKPTPISEPKPMADIKPLAESKVAPVLEAKLEPKSEAVEEPKLDSEPIVETKLKKAQSNFLTSLKKKFSLKFANSSMAEKLAEERREEEAARHKDEVEERYWQPYNGVKANLIKDQGVLFFNWKQRLLTLSLALVLCCLAIGLVYVGLLVWQKERLNDNQSTLANFEAINAEVSKNEKDIQEIITFNRKLEISNFILNNHIYWSNYFAFLEANTLKDVYFQNFSGDLTGKYNIPAVARNFDSISLQLEVMKSYNLMRSVQYSGAAAVPGSAGVSDTVKFNLEMSVDPKIFVK